MKYYHGTAASNLESIKQHGILVGADKIWNCSRNEVYLWSEKGYPGCVYRSTNFTGGFQQAVSSSVPAMIAKKDTRCIVVESELDEKLVLPDTSCSNPNALCYKGNVPLERITKISLSDEFGMWIPLLSWWLMNNKLYSKSFSNADRKLSDIICFVTRFGNEHFDDLIESLSWTEEYKTEVARELELA